MQKDFDKVKKFDLYDKMKGNKCEYLEYLIKTTALKDQLEVAIEQVNSFNEREQLLNQPQSEYQELYQLQTNFKPFSKIWELVN